MQRRERNLEKKTKNENKRREITLHKNEKNGETSVGQRPRFRLFNGPASDVIDFHSAPTKVLIPSPRPVVMSVCRDFRNSEAEVLIGNAPGMLKTVS